MDMTLGKSIARIRKERGLSQDALAYLCKMNLRSIQRIESGQVKPRPYTLKTISDVLQYDFLHEDAKSQKMDFAGIRQTIIGRLSAVWLWLKGEAKMTQNILQRLCKSRTDRKIAGICGGLGENTEVPSWFWRVLFLAAIPLFAIGVVLYVLLWVFMPATKEGQIVQEHGSNWLNQFSRSGHDRKIGGVCGGLGESTPIPSWCWRIVFVVLVPLYGSSVFAYLLLWIFAPMQRSIVSAEQVA